MPPSSDKDQLIRWLIKDKYGGVHPNSEAFLQDVARIEAGEPIAYVIGWVNFLDAHIDLSQKTLIPRPETEYWVGQAISEMKETSSPRILDLCCGSGCIGIAVLEHLPQARVEFADIDSQAISQTKLNLRINKIESSRSKVLQGHLLQPCSGEYDVILTNPPYVSFSGEVGEETKYEPSSAIFAQKEGISLIEEILFNAKKYLKKSGKLYLEFGKGQEPMVEMLAKKANWNNIEFRKDQFGVTRWVLLSK